MRGIFRAQAEEVLHSISLGCRHGAGGAGSPLPSPRQGEAQDGASPPAVAEAMLRETALTKSPVVFVSFFVDTGTLFCQDLLSLGTSGTLQVPANIYSLPHKLWEMNFILGGKPNSSHSSAHPVAIFFPFPLPVTVTSTVSHHPQLWQKHMDIPWWAPLTFPYPNSSTHFTEICLNPPASFLTKPTRIRMSLAEEKYAFP